MEMIRAALEESPDTMDVTTTANPVTVVKTLRGDGQPVDGVLIDGSDLAAVQALPDMGKEVPL